MIFWILVGIAAVITIAVIVYCIMDDGVLWALGMGLCTALISAAALGIIGGLAGSAVAYATGWDDSDTERSELRALSASSSIEGRFYFLGGGYIDGKRVLNYIVQQNGYSTLEQADASDSRIYEDEQAAPYVESTYTTRWNTWIVPWPVAGGEQHNFHIPEDSILENYTIDNAAG